MCLNDNLQHLKNLICRSPFSRKLFLDLSNKPTLFFSGGDTAREQDEPSQVEPPREPAHAEKVPGDPRQPPGGQGPLREHPQQPRGADRQAKGGNRRPSSQGVRILFVDK